MLGKISSPVFLAQRMRHRAPSASARPDSNLSGTRAGGRSSGSPGPREEAGPGRDIGLWAPVLLLLLLLCWCLEEEGVPAAPSPLPYNLANSDPMKAASKSQGPKR